LPRERLFLERVMIMAMTIEQLESAPVMGNAFSDSDLLENLDQFLISDASMADKVRAIAVLDKVMGLDDEANEGAVIDYLAERAELFGEMTEQSESEE
jgi:hypothetical protein